MSECFEPEYVAVVTGGRAENTGFDAFSHTKSIVDKKTWVDLPMRYQPYRDFYGKLLKIFLR